MHFKQVMSGKRDSDSEHGALRVTFLGPGIRADQGHVLESELHFYVSMWLLCIAQLFH